MKERHITFNITTQVRCVAAPSWLVIVYTMIEWVIINSHVQCRLGIVKKIVNDQTKKPITSTKLL